MPDEILSQISDLKTDKQELDKTLERYDLDELLEQEFNAIDQQFRQLEIQYQSLKNARRFLNNG
jgi:flagellar capping protein FliD